ncbi:MAG: hypothetical protein ACLPPF_18905 [Rhodomicrobium sp.]
MKRLTNQPARSGKRRHIAAGMDAVKTWTIRCVAQLPSVNTVEAEAKTLEAACAKAITITNDYPH